MSLRGQQGAFGMMGKRARKRGSATPSTATKMEAVVDAACLDPPWLSLLVAFPRGLTVRAMLSSFTSVCVSVHMAVLQVRRR